MLPRHLSNNKSSTHRSCTVIGHLIMSSCSEKIDCKTWQPEHHHEWQENEFRWSSQQAESFHWQVGQSYGWEWFSSEKDRLEIQFTWSSILLWNMRDTTSKMHESHVCNQSFITEASMTMHSTLQWVLLSKYSTQELESFKWRPWWLDGTHAKSFLAAMGKRECSIHAIQLTLP